MFDRRDLSVAVIAAHPDDEVLGCGATMARHAAAGHRVHTLILGSGLDARGDAPESAHDALRAQAAEAARLLGAPPPRLADLPDNRFDERPLLEVIRHVECFLAQISPQVVYTHHRGDLNVDHRLTHDAVMTACRPLPGPRRILAFEVLSSSEWQSPQMPAFQPTVFHDAAGSLEAKLAAMAAYAGELRPWPHPRSLEGIRHQAALRGAQAGLAAAEAFVLLREVH